MRPRRSQTMTSMRAAHVLKLTRIGLVTALSIALAACAPALSNAPRPAATASPPPRVVSTPPPASPAPLAPAPPVARAPEPPQVITAPLVEPPPPISVPEPAHPIGSTAQVPVAPPGAPAFSPPPPVGIAPPAAKAAPEQASATPTRIAIVLPLQSAAFGAAAEAVQAGFSAAAELANVKIEVIPHGDGDVLGAIDKARVAQTRVMAGPLLRDDVKALATLKEALPWTIALNQLEDDVSLPDRVYTLALSVEGEARQIARTMQADGVRTVAVVASDSALQRRFASSFTGEWILLGGGPPATYSMVRATDMLATLRQELLRVAPEAIVLAANAIDAALVKPYLPRSTVYASSQINERGAVPIMSDLDDIHFVEVPWLVEPEAPQFSGVPRRDYPSTTLERLYALGLDAFAVAQAFDRGPPQQLDIEGATGHLTLDAHHHVVRQGRLAHLEAGHLVPDAPH